MHVLMLPLHGAFFVIALGMALVKLFALVDAATRPAQAFPATGKQTKPFWLIVLVVAVLSTFLGFLSIIGFVAALVYLLDVRPAIRESHQR